MENNEKGKGIFAFMFKGLPDVIELSLFRKIVWFWFMQMFGYPLILGIFLFLSMKIALSFSENSKQKNTIEKVTNKTQTR
jgi:hypothetical protein